MLKSSAGSIAYPLCRIFNLSISSGLVPLEWKSSFVVPSPKSSPASSSASNYRPISLLNLISKLLEKHMHSILYDFCINSNLISPIQFGFLPHHSTTSALLFSSHSILSLLESHTSVCGIFLDLRKAFDSVPHQPLIDLLASYNLPYPLLQWLHSYLLNRSQQVVLNGTSSSPLPVTSGVPQGSIIGPLLFIIYINAITHLSFFPQTHLILYADDIFVFKPISFSTDLSNLHLDLDNISSWLTSHLLHLNSSKSKYMFFSHKSSSNFDCFPPLSISHTPIDLVSSYRYLGVLLSSSLSWAPHIAATCSKARKVLGLMFRHFCRNSSASTLIKLYKTLVHPILEYCSVIWDPSSLSLSHSLEAVQHFAIKLASRFRPSLVASIYSDFKISSLATRRHHAKLIFLFKLLHDHLFFPFQITRPLHPPPYPLRSFHPKNLICPHTKKSSFKKSFIPSTIYLWDSLPPKLKETNSLSLFSSLLTKLAPSSTP